MPLKEYQIDSYQGLQSLLEKIPAEGEEIFVFFSCTLDKHGDPTTKVCFAAEDVLMEYTEFVRNSKRKLHLIYFRKLLEDYYQPISEIKRDKYLRINAVPTLIKWKSYQRLVGKQCTQFSLLSMVFEEECPKKFPVYTPCNYFPPKEPQPEPDGGSKAEVSNQETPAVEAQPDGPYGDANQEEKEAKEVDEVVKPPAVEPNNQQQPEVTAQQSDIESDVVSVPPTVEPDDEHPQG